MNTKQLIGAGDKIMGFTLPFALAGVTLNVLHPQCFAMNTDLAGIIIGSALLAFGIPLWAVSVVLMLKYVPQNKLIAAGPFLLVTHPIYTSAALLVIPGLTFVFDTWLGFPIGAILYGVSRIFRGQEEEALRAAHKEAYQAYRSQVRIPWL